MAATFESLKQKIEYAGDFSEKDRKELIRIVDAYLFLESDFRANTMHKDYRLLEDEALPVQDEYGEDDLPGVKFFEDCMVIYRYEKNELTDGCTIIFRETDMVISGNLLVHWFDTEEDKSLFFQNVAIASINGKFGLINKESEFVTSLNYDHINTALCYIRENKYALWYKREGRYGFINLNGKKILNDEFDALRSFHTGDFGYQSFYFAVQKNGKWGLLYDNLEPGLLCEYKSIEVFYDHFHMHTNLVYALVQNEKGQFGLFLPYHGWLVKPEWDDFHLNSERYIVAFKKGKKRGIYNLHKKRLIVFKYEIKIDEIICIEGNEQFFVITDEITGKYAVADAEFNLFTDFIFDHPPDYYQSTGTFVVYHKKNSLYYKDRTEYPFSTFMKLYGYYASKKKEKTVEGRKNPAVIEKPAAEKKDPGYLFTSEIAGTMFYANKWKRKPETDEKLVLRHEPKNKYDINAILVLLPLENEKEQKLGYIPRNKNVQLVELLKKGNHIFAKISECFDVFSPPEYNIDVFRKIE